MAALHQTIFDSNSSLRITRQRLLTHSYPNPDQKTAEILLWGYQSNKRGLVGNLLHQLAAVTAAASTNTTDWYTYYDSFKGSVSGANISTITKFAYFHSRSFLGRKTGVASPALILDNRLLAALPRWVEVDVPGLTRTTARARYVSYLARMEAVASSLRATPDQLELFLFSSGHSY
ncbi:MAG: hypothetical protein QM755_01105 [Luteolibacter sp.]